MKTIELPKRKRIEAAFDSFSNIENAVGTFALAFELASEFPVVPAPGALRQRRRPVRSANLWPIAIHSRSMSTSKPRIVLRERDKWYAGIHRTGKRDTFSTEKNYCNIRSTYCNINS